MWIFRILLICVVVLFVQLVVVPSIDIFLVGIILTTFFYHNEQGIAFALLGGFLRDLFYATYGFHIVLYALIALIGILLIQSIITHRSFWGFAGFSLILLLSAYLITFAFAFTAGMVLHAGIAYHSMLFGIHFILLLCGYVLFGRLQKGMQYVISIERI